LLCETVGLWCVCLCVAVVKVNPQSAELPTHDGNYPLHLACVSGNVTVIDHLLAVARVADRHRRQQNSSAADTADKDSFITGAVNVLDVRRRSPLHVAVINRRLDAVRRLLSVRGLGDGIARGSHMWRRCRTIDHSPLVDIDAADADGYSALHLAVMGDGLHSYTDVMTLLLQCGADANRLPTTTTCEGLFCSVCYCYSRYSFFDSVDY